MRAPIPLALALALLLPACGGDDAPGRDGGGLDAFGAVTDCPPADDLGCESASEICVIETPRVPGPVSSCEPVPEGCDEDRSCSCAGRALCEEPFNSCSEGPGNTITCSCPTCQ
jgi:hypothetical protein